MKSHDHANEQRRKQNGSNQMKIFIGWWDEIAGKQLAKALYNLIKVCFETKEVEPWMCEKSIEAGDEWFNATKDAASSADIAILCLTHHALARNWLFLEIGMLLNRPGKENGISHIIPCVDKPELIKSLPVPLNRLQSQEANKEGFEQIIKRIRSGTQPQPKSGITDAYIQKNYASHIATAVAQANKSPTRHERARAALALKGICVSGESCLVGGNIQIGRSLAEEIRRFSTVINTMPSEVQEIRSAVYWGLANKLRSEEDSSIHVMYATADSIGNYYEKVNNNWVSSETPHKTLENRRRFLVLETSSMSTAEYMSAVSRVYARLSDTCELKVIEDSQIPKEHLILRRDIGVFQLKKKSAGLARYCHPASENIFSQSPGAYYHITNKKYLKHVFDDFDKAWLDDKLNVLSNDNTKVLERFLSKSQNESAAWDVAEHSLSKSSIEALFENKIPAIRISNFATQAECEKFNAAASAYTVTPYKLGESDPSIEKIGEPLYEHRSQGNNADYWAAAAKSTDQYLKICEVAGWNPVQRMIDTLISRVGSIKVHSDCGKYFAGLIRYIEESALPHIDYAPHDASGFSVEKIQRQIVWNLVLDAPKDGGECVVYDSSWCEGYESCKCSDSYGYDRNRVTRGARQFKIRPIRGDVTIFNCRNFHEVTSAVGGRATVGSFIGQFNDGKYIWWS